MTPLPPAASAISGHPLEATLPSRGLSFGHPAVLAAIPSVLLASLIAAWIWASGPVHATAHAASEARPQPPPAGTLSPLFTAQVLRWEAEIQRWAAGSRLDPNLVAAVIQIESCGDPGAVSSSGALGLFQVMPFHFHSGEEPLDVETNARRGMEYLARSLDLAQGRTDLALAGYNGGHGVIGRPPETWPAETQRYVSWGNGILVEIAAGLRESPTLRAWLSAGGERLCRRADLRPAGP